jgi:uncharacterized protein (UPF0261 family)
VAKTIVILGTLDTKGEILHLLKKQIEGRGHDAVILDLSMGSAPAFPADIPATAVARAAGHIMEDLISARNRSVSTDVMIVGAQQIVMGMLSRKELDGIVAMGGASVALIASRIMARLPFGMPKVIATPAAMPTYVAEWFGPYDVTIMQVIMEMSGMNNLLEGMVAVVGGAIAGMVEEAPDFSSLKLPYPSVAVTQIGFNEECAVEVERLLEERGYHVYPFHANGISDRSMERLIAQGFLDGLIDIVPAGLIEELFQGNRAAGMERLDAPLERGIPVVLAPSTFNITGAGPTRRLKERFINRQPRVQIDEIRFMTRYAPDEMRQGARLYAAKLNRSKGPVKFLVPLKGWSNVDKPGSPLYNPEQDRVFFEELKANLTRDIPMQPVNCNLEDPKFALALVESFDEMFREKGVEKKNV